MNYEEKMRMMQYSKPEIKDILLAKLIKGETIDITKDEDMFYQINADRMSMDDFINRGKYKEDAEAMKKFRSFLNDPTYGKTKNGQQRLLGHIPNFIYYTHPWFSPRLSREERSANIKKFFNLYPAFRAGSKQI